MYLLEILFSWKIPDGEQTYQVLLYILLKVCLSDKVIGSSNFQENVLCNANKKNYCCLFLMLREILLIFKRYLEPGTYSYILGRTCTN